jgi:hypothetical protein
MGELDVASRGGPDEPGSSRLRGWSGHGGPPEGGV